MQKILVLKIAMLVLVMLATVSGCATMGKSECLTADWRTIGFEDGATGKNETAISEYRQDCADHGITPNLTAYRLGHRQGAERYCTLRNGFAVGRAGSRYQNSCPAELETNFLAGYRDGQTLHTLQRALNSARSAIDKQLRLLTTLEQDIVLKTDVLVEDGLNKEQRLTVLAEIDSIKASLLEASYVLPALEREIQRAESALARAEARLKY
jgi:hypothetical protein